MATLKIHEQQKEWALKASIGGAVLLFCILAIIRPVFQDIAALRQTILDSQKRSELYQVIRGLNKSVSDGESTLALASDRSMLLGKISDIASQTHVDVETLTPRTEPDGGYIKLKIEMEGSGTFFSLLKFLKGIEKLNISLKVRDVAVLRQPTSADQGKGKNPLQIHMIFETLLKQRVKK